jgi:hypothetical protein
MAAMVAIRLPPKVPTRYPPTVSDDHGRVRVPAALPISPGRMTRKTMSKAAPSLGWPPSREPAARQDPRRTGCKGRARKELRQLHLHLRSARRLPRPPRALTQRPPAPRGWGAPAAKTSATTPRVQRSKSPRIHQWRQTTGEEMSSWLPFTAGILLSLRHFGQPDVGEVDRPCGYRLESGCFARRSTAARIRIHSQNGPSSPMGRHQHVAPRFARICSASLSIIPL